ncbi:MAG TPA: DUF2530 domain-containing protein [Actinomycetaceae bacterium]|nr:DUF2530 domain-containing protein [Actinomycetaceae bacterium]
MPVARVRVTPIALGGTIVWAVALTVVLVADLGTLARDIGLVGTFLGLIATPVARAYDSRHTRAATSSHPGG